MFSFSLHLFKLLFSSPLEQEATEANSKLRSSFFIVLLIRFLNIRKYN